MGLFGKKGEAGLLGVSWDEAGACLARVSRRGSRPRVEFLDCQVGPPAELLPRLARAGGGRHIPCATVLASGEYQLLPTEVPNVPRDELRGAIRWLVKDLVPFEPEDMAVDVFAAPLGRSGQPDAFYAVVASRARVQEKVGQLEEAGFAARIVDIPEMAQRNLAALADRDGAGVLMLSLSGRGGLVTVSRRGALYFSRRLALNPGELAGGDEAVYERLALELQRSLDYYDSHFDPPPIARVLLAPLPDELRGVQTALEARLAVPVARFEVAEVLDWRRPPPPLSPLGLATLGAALREEEVLP